MLPKNKGKTASDIVIASQKALSEAKQSFKKADEVRKEADKSGKLLKPDDIISGKVDSGKLMRLLTTMPNGKLRPITLSDVLEFDKRRSQLRQKWQSGVKARDIVDFSKVTVPGQHQSDLTKAREQIHSAVPVSTKAGELKFSTSTGPNSDRARHYVTIRMMNFEAAVASPSDPQKIAKEVVHGPLHIGCSCGQWRFVFAYMATAGGYGLAEHREPAFPKLKNPTLTGIACKHIVKVASMLDQSPALRNHVARLIEVERNKTQSKQARVAKAAQEKLLAELQKDNYRQRRIATTEEKKAERARWKKAKPAEASVQEKAAQKAKEKAAKQSMKAVQNNATKLLQLGVINQQQYDQMLAALGAK